MTVVSSFFTFPPVSWWMHVAQADTVIFDGCEHFEKMTGRNRYHISGANNSILLTIPLINGRNQHVPMSEVSIYNGAGWQLQHWRTLLSVYRRSPYFEHYEDSLKMYFETRFTSLVEFNRSGIDWVKAQLKLDFKEKLADAYIKQYPPDICDLRKKHILNESDAGKEFQKYYQVFEDRAGFIPDLSILDLLFSEGPYSLNILRLNK